MGVKKKQIPGLSLFTAVFFCTDVQTPLNILPPIGRQCNSYTENKQQYLRSEMINLIKVYNIYIYQNINIICKTTGQFLMNVQLQ